MTNDIASKKYKVTLYIKPSFDEIEYFIPKEDINILLECGYMKIKGIEYGISKSTYIKHDDREDEVVIVLENQPTEEIDINSSHIEVFRHILDLLDTMEDGIIYVEQKLEENNPQGSIGVFPDLLDAFSSIQQSLDPAMEQLGANSIYDKTQKLQSAFEAVVDEYENNQGQIALDIIQCILQPSFKKWRQELETVLRPYTLS